MLRIFSVDPGLSPAVAVAQLPGYDFKPHFTQANQDNTASSATWKGNTDVQHAT